MHHTPTAGGDRVPARIATPTAVCARTGADCGSTRPPLCLWCFSTQLNFFFLYSGYRLSINTSRLFSCTAAVLCIGNGITSEAFATDHDTRLYLLYRSSTAEPGTAVYGILTYTGAAGLVSTAAKQSQLP